MQTTLTRDECKIVQATFAQIDPIADLVAAEFYRKLFELNPSLIGLFKTDMTVQGARFMEKLAIVVKGLEDLEPIAGFVRELGRRHATYGVAPHDYDTVAVAWLWALENALGRDFKPDVREAWERAYGLISRTMLEGAAQ